MKNIIWCEVTCGCCGAAANSCGYYSPDRIKRLKAETKDWAEDENYRVLCPACVAKIRPQKSKEKTNQCYDEAIAATIASGKAEQILNSDKAQCLVSVFDIFKEEKE